jgi:biotin synthase
MRFAVAGANSIFYGEKLLTTPNPRQNSDLALFRKLGIEPESRTVHSDDDSPLLSDNRAQDQVGGVKFTNAAR